MVYDERCCGKKTRCVHARSVCAPAGGWQMTHIVMIMARTWSRTWFGINRYPDELLRLVLLLPSLETLIIANNIPTDHQSIRWNFQKKLRRMIRRTHSSLSNSSRRGQTRYAMLSAFHTALCLGLRYLSIRGLQTSSRAYRVCLLWTR